MDPKPTTPTPPSRRTLVIPKYDDDDTPPVTNTPPPGPAPIVPSVSDDDFLKSVRDSNEAKIKKTGESPPPTSKEDSESDSNSKEKPDTTPPVFKRDEEKPVEDDGDEDAGDFEDPMEEIPPPKKKTREGNIKELKTQLSTVRGRNTQLQSRVEELETQIQNLDGLKEAGTELETLRTRVAQLEPLERVLDIHNNPEFQAQYVEAPRLIAEQAKNIARQYLQDPNNASVVIDNALKIRNRRELNDYLKKAGFDDLGIQDVRQYIFEAQTLDDQRSQLEKTPEEAKEYLQELFRQGEAERVKTLQSTVKTRGESTWRQMVGFYSRSEYPISAFKEKPGDPEHTQKRNGVLTRAKDQYDKVLSGIVSIGARELPPALAQNLAARFQLAEWCGEFANENESLKQEVKDLRKQLDSEINHTRPPMTHRGGGEGRESNKEVDPKDHAAIAFSRAQEKSLNGSSR